MILYDHMNNPILLGEELGRGGEGLVYTIQGDTNNVAKVYHNTVISEKEEKLKVMVVNGLDLSQFTAWPSATLHDQPRGMVRGFIMPRVSGHREVHELYGPAHRKVQFPNADWAFLIHAARNIAAAFQAIHDCGHTIGDVNQSGILISQQAVCRLIDTDSFQIRLGNKVYSCEVGTPHFTPPELQGRSFRGILREKNHDNFGLAVIIFQLLFMGRHPFAGRYSGSGDMPIERSIREYRFAFGAKASTKQMAPPPNTLDLSVCTSSVEQLFVRAFSEEGVFQENRPNAQEWVQQLDALQDGLRVCSKSPAHRYHRSLSSCPWCSLESISGTVYFLVDSTTGSTQSNFNLEEVWLKIQAIKIPSMEQLPNLKSIRVRPTPLPEYAKPPTGFLGFVNFFFDLHDDRGERKKRESILRQAEQQWKIIESQHLALQSDSGFNNVYVSIKNWYIEYKDLANQYQVERRASLLKIYLERYFIENAEISNIGKKRALVLASYGIETAADVSEYGVASIPGFGPVLTQNLVEWRNTLEARFQRYNPSPQDLAALNGVDQKYARRRSELESRIVGGKAQLENRRDDLIKKRERLVRKEIEDVARKLAQARADMNVYS
jgi:DNA-binding helix-hairpin-helix protein with protein kinase domain